MINIASPIIGSEEIQAVNEVLASGMLAQGPKVAELEELFAEYCGTKYALAVNSGTAAIHAALFAAGVSEGDEVITTPFSFIATINPILMLGAKPVLVDIDPKIFAINVDHIEAAITDKTKAIIPVHLYGQPCDWDKIAALAEKYNLKVIEDACQAIGAAYNAKKTGSLGDLGCFSLYATKNIMCGEGGVITTNNEQFAEAIKRFRQHGMSGPYQYEHIGYNYRLTDLQAAIAVEQLKKTDTFNIRRVENAIYITEQLADIQGLILPAIKQDRTHVFHQYTLRVTASFPLTRDDFLAKLREGGVGAAVYYPKPLHAIEHIANEGYSLGDFPEAERAANEVISLPIHPALTKDDLRTICDVIKGIANVN